MAYRQKRIKRYANKSLSHYTRPVKAGARSSTAGMRRSKARRGTIVKPGAPSTSRGYFFTGLGRPTPVSARQMQGIRAAQSWARGQLKNVRIREIPRGNPDLTYSTTPKVVVTGWPKGGITGLYKGAAKIAKRYR